MENTELDTKKWKRNKEATKEILKATPKNEHVVYFVNFQDRTLENRLDVSEKNILDLNFTKNTPIKK